MKKLTLAALAATFITGSAAVANAEISSGGAPPGPTSERGLQRDHARQGSYAYAPTRSHRSHRNSVRVKRTPSTK
jgi:hypothetical protein